MSALEVCKACQVPGFRMSFTLSWSTDVGVIFTEELVEASCQNIV